MKKTICLLAVAIAFTIGCSNVKKEDNLDLHKKNVEVAPQKKEYSTQKKLLEEHNSRRTNQGLHPLILDDKLCKYAQNHAKTMSQKEKLYHSNISNMIGGETSLVGENVAWGQENEKSVVEAWMWSPMHRWNILGTNYKKVGFGVSEDKDGRKYWCTVFTN